MVVDSKKKLMMLILLLLGSSFSFAGSSQEGGAFNPGETILHHITDAHEWHLFSIDGEHYSIPLPVILYSPQFGLEVFMSSHLTHAPDRTYGNFRLDEHGHIEYLADSSAKVYDISITKNVASMLLSVVILLAIFLSIASRYKKNPASAPKGLQSFFEPIIMYIRDDVAKPAIGSKYERYMPYLLTIFFFIWFNNLLGLFPAGANLTGNIAVTGMLALFTFLITTFSGNKYYWAHVFWTPGVPIALKPIIVIIEFVGLFIKPFSLMVRLFANITAGHIIILSLLGLIFLFKSVYISLVSVPFSLFMMLLEMFVAILQAYIFTLLSAMYFGAAVEEHHHDEHEVDKALY